MFLPFNLFFNFFEKNDTKNTLLLFSSREAQEKSRMVSILIN
jgi:hypothetical protein